MTRRPEPGGGPPADPRRGAVLLMSLGILAMMVLFAVSLASIVRLEARAAANLTDATRAQLVADAGLERAIFQLSHSELEDPVRAFHAPWTYRSQDGSTWGLGQPLRTARCPSFLAGRLESESGEYAYSGVVAGTYTPDGDQFVLKVVDAASRLSLNGEQATLPRMLEALGQAILEFDTRRRDPDDPLYDAGYVEWIAARQEESADVTPRNPIPPGRGAEILALRESLGGRFVAVEQLRALLGDDDLERLRDFVSADSWLDPAMVGFDAAGEEVPEQRAPVNLNTASWPVLVAVFQGIRAARRVHPDDGQLGLDAAAARELALHIDRFRRGLRVSPTQYDRPGELFRGWMDFERFLTDLAAEGLLSLSLTQRAALLANVNPNLTYARRNPDGTLHRGLGKADLAFATTELSFISYGIYEVTSLGRILSPDGLPVAEVEVHAAVGIYDTLRLLTQSDFENARTSDEIEQSASFPNPVRAMTGAYRSSSGDEGVMFEPIADPELRRSLRVQTGSSRSGYVQLIAAEPDIPLPPDRMEGLWDYYVQLVRFGADLRAETFWWQRLNEDLNDDPDGPRQWATRPTPLQALDTPSLFGYPGPDGGPGSVAGRVYDFALRAGIPPETLGGPSGDMRDPFPGRAVYREDLGPDGLLIHPERVADVRFPNHHRYESDPEPHPSCGDRMPPRDYDGDGVPDPSHPPNPPWCIFHSLLTGRALLGMWFKLNQSPLDGPWTPLLEAWLNAEGHYARDDSTTWVKWQLEARLLHVEQEDRYQLQVRSRRWSSLAPRIYAGPPNPDADAFNRATYAIQVEWEVDEARASEWHYLFIPYLANVHFPFVDGRAGTIQRDFIGGDPSVLEGAPWNWVLPNWPDELDPTRPENAGLVSPGGFVYAGSNRPTPFVEATVDDLFTSSYQMLIRRPLNEDDPDFDPDWQLPPYTDMRGTISRRFHPLGPDHVGSFSAELPSFDRDVQVGRLLWTEYLPRRWGQRAFESGDFQSQSSYRYSSETPREHMSGRRVPEPPSLERMSDEYVRFWRLRYLRERMEGLQALVEQYQRLSERSQDAAAQTFLAYRDAFAAEVAGLQGEETELLGDPPQEPTPPADAGSSLAFDAEGIAVPEGRQVRFRIDFVYYDHAIGPPPPPNNDGTEPVAQTPVLNASPCLDDVILPYQDRPRVLRYRVVE